jgi:large subunit ribosomal protein L28
MPEILCQASSLSVESYALILDSPACSRQVPTDCRNDKDIKEKDVKKILYNVYTMAYRCKICGKGVLSGKSYSHSHKATKRVFKPNLQRKKIVLKGKVQSVYVCTACIKSGLAVRKT